MHPTTKEATRIQRRYFAQAKIGKGQTSLFFRTAADDSRFLTGKTLLGLLISHEAETQLQDSRSTYSTGV